MTGAAVILVGFFVGGGAFYVGQASADTPTLQVQTNDHIDYLHSAQIQVHIQHGTASSYAVTIQVAAPTGAGGPFCDSVTLTTDGGGNGQISVNYPGTFAASACTPKGTGGPNTILPGAYGVTVSSSPSVTLGTLSTTFKVLPPRGVVTGTATYTALGTSTNTVLNVLCPGVPAGTTATTSNSFYTTDRVGTFSFTGVITSNTPGQADNNQLHNPCVTPSVTAGHAVYTFNDVTVTLPDGKSITGGVIITSDYTVMGIATATVPNSVWSNVITLTGTGGLDGASGTLVCVQSTLGTASTDACWVKLTNVPGGGDE